MVCFVPPCLFCRSNSLVIHPNKESSVYCTNIEFKPFCLSAEQPDAKKAAKKGSSAVPNAFASFFKKADTATGGRKSASNSSTKEDSRKNRDSPKKDSKKNRDSPKKDSRKNRDSPKKDSAKKNVDSPKNESSRKRRKAADGAEGTGV